AEGAAEGDASEDPNAYGGANLKELSDRLRHYRRFKAPRYAYMGAVDGFQLEAFAESIEYDLQVLVRHLEPLSGDALVIIMGDHQPPLVSDADQTYDVPMHVLARDPALLEEFRLASFVDGMQLDPESYTALNHEGVLSLMVRALVRCCGEPGTELPPVHPAGIRIGN